MGQPASRRMSERENTLRTLEFRSPEWIPVTFDLSESAWMKWGEALEAVVLRHPLVFPSYHRGSYPRRPTDPFYEVYESLRDDWGCIWRNTTPGILGQVVGHPLADWSAFEKFRPPDPKEQFDWRAMRAGVEEARSCGDLVKASISVTQGGFFDRLQFLRGMENLMLDFATHPSQLSTLIEMVLEYNLEYDRLCLDMGIDFFHFHGDIGTQKSLLFSPATFRRYLKPAFEEMFSACRKAGAHVFYSSDGRVVDLVPDLIECGISLHDPQLGPNLLEEIARVYGGRLCASVDIDEQSIPFATPAELHECVRRVVETLRNPRGGLMLYLYCYHDAPLENIDALCCAAEEFCFFSG